MENGIQMVSSELQRGGLVICASATNLIREMEGYCWDPKDAAKGYDSPLKINDHACDALRYVVASHKIPTQVYREDMGSSLGFR